MRSITIKEIRRYPIALPYKTPFRASYGEQTHKIAVIIEAITTEGISGWGEASLEEVPRYGYETIPTALHILDNFLFPTLLGQTIHTPAEISQYLNQINGHPFTKAGFDAALWDALAKTNQQSLLSMFADFVNEEIPTQPSVKSGVVVGIQPTVEETLAIVQQRINEGYRALKLKVSPHQDTRLLQIIRAEFPEIQIMVDANGAYANADLEALYKLDALNLLLIEQPFPARDLLSHQKACQHMQTPICLDESIGSLADTQLVRQLSAVGVINIKPARVGGFTEALKIYQFGRAHDLQIRVGGMLETGLGRAGILQFAALSGFTLPADISATDRYFAEDLTRSFELNADGTLTPPDGFGIGVEVDQEILQKYLFERN